MRNNNIKKLFVAVIATVFITLFIGNGLVNAKRAIVLSPTSQRIVLVPGERYYGTVRVTNPADSDQDLQYEATVGSYSVSSTKESNDDYGEANIESRTAYNEIMDWITIQTPNGTLSPNEEGTVDFAIDVPENAPAGGQYATILVKDVSPREETSGNLGISESIQMAATLYAEVAGETKQEGEISKNNLPGFLMNNKLEATSMVRNNGNIHTDAEYTLQVWPLFSNEEICTNEEEAETSLVLPETERYHAQSCNLPTVGVFRAKQTVKIFGEVSEIERMVIVCPIWLLFIVIFVIFALIFYFIARAKARKKASQKTSRS